MDGTILNRNSKALVIIGKVGFKFCTAESTGKVGVTFCSADSIETESVPVVSPMIVGSCLARIPLCISMRNGIGSNGRLFG